MMKSSTKGSAKRTNSAKTPKKVNKTFFKTGVNKGKIINKKNA